MTTKDFTQLFPEILNPAAFSSKLKALCRSKKFPEDELTFCLHDFALVKIDLYNFSFFKVKE